MREIRPVDMLFLLIMAGTASLLWPPRPADAARVQVTTNAAAFFAAPSQGAATPLSATVRQHGRKRAGGAQ